MSAVLAGKVAVVTGASRGIGAAIAERLAADGASVVVNYSRQREAAEVVVARIRERGGRAQAVAADVTDRAQVRALFDETERLFGVPDVLVNNAGVLAFAPLEAVDDAHFDGQFDVNVRGLLYATQEAAARFGERGGRVVNLSSVAAAGRIAGASVYSATKAAVDALTASLALELGPRGIRVNAVAPGPVRTDMYQESGLDAHRDALAARTPLGRIGEPEDVANVVAHLASDDSGWVTGHVVPVAGGFQP